MSKQTLAQFKKSTLQVALASALFATMGSSFAGEITLPAADSSATVYAAEALAINTVVTTPSITYTMGVNRAINQDFTIVYTPSAGATLDAASCVAANFSGGGSNGASLTFSTKRASANECAIQVGVPSATDTSTTITSSGAAQALKLTGHPLASAGQQVSYTVNLWDLGETARIDNSVPKTRVVGTSVHAINVYAAATDTATVADVNAVAGPLMGFLANATAPADIAARAAAAITLDNNSVGAKGSDGVTAFDFTNTTGTVTLTLTDATKAFSGLLAGGLCADFNNNGTFCEATEAFATPVASAATISIPASAFPAQGPVATRTVTFQADGLTNLGTSRTLSVATTVTPQVGLVHAGADTALKNGTWWTWSANAIELWSPYFSTAPGWISRFAFQNTGTAVGYTATCAAEVGNVVTPGAAISGNLAAGMTVIDAATVCGFSGLTRGNVRFIINAPAGNIHGTYNLVNAATGSTSISEMTRPFGTVAGTTW